MNTDINIIKEDKKVPLNQTELKTLFQLFEEQVDKYPENTAIINENISITYSELDKKVNSFAAYLIQSEISSGKFVGIYLERSELPIIAILAVLKSGAAYVPLDPSYPQERIKYIIDETDISLVISQDKLIREIGAENINCPHVIIENFDYKSYSNNRPQVSTIPSDLCYILFTSGSTGRPKGIMTEHRNVTSFIESFNKEINLNHTDRVYQGFSLGFDGSVEEMWMAFSNGAALITGNQIATKLPDEASRLINKFNATVFSTVPTFLKLIKKDMPSIRLAILSGEKCPQELVNKWHTNNRRILNVYGPTETTVNATVKECHPNDTEMTIGFPLSNYDTYILDINKNIVNDGDDGELYIGGPGVSRGYFKRDDLNKDTFIRDLFKNGSDEVIYKTGDKVRRLPNGELFFYGRLDTQVKVRGFRVELSEIEKVIYEFPTVDIAAVCPIDKDGHIELAAYIKTVDNSKDFNYDGLITLLKSKLIHYMIPNYCDILENFPMLASGKIDRNNFPKPKRALVLSEKNIIAPKNDTEQKLLKTWKKILKTENISTNEDFFTDLGGYSLLAVELSVELREKENINVSVRDIYKYTTINSMAEHISEKCQEAPKDKNKKCAKSIFNSVSKLERLGVYLLQLLTIVAIATYSTTVFAGLFKLFVAAYDQVITASTFIIALSAFSLLAFPIHLLLCIALKWVIIGKFSEGRYPVYGLYYFRWWLVSKLSAISGATLFTGTPVMSLYYKLMGAKIGSNTIINTSQCSIFDLITVGNNTSIGNDTQILGCKIENLELIIGKVTIGNDCYIGNYSCLDLNSEMKNGSILDDMSLVKNNQILNEDKQYSGSPAQENPVKTPVNKHKVTEKKRPFIFGLIHLLAIECLSLISLFMTLPVILLTVWFIINWGVNGAIAAIILDSTIGIIYYCLAVASIKKILLPRFRPGTYSLQSFFYVRKNLVSKLLMSSSVFLRSIYTTIYLPSYLRLLGAKIGKRAEISTVTRLEPDLIDIGDESFFADGSMIGGGRIYDGVASYEKNTIGKRSFVGNSSMLAPGKSLGDNCLQGVLSLTPIEHKQTPDGSEWLGSPSFSLPFRKKITSFDAKETFKPTMKLYITRCFIDACRVMIPHMVGMTILCAVTIYLFWAYKNASFSELTLHLLLINILSTIFALSVVVILKKILMGKFKPVIKPLWSVYVWLNELVNGAYETISTPLMSPFIGTPFYNIYLRLMGCKVGKNSYVGTSLFSEFDLIEIGDYCSLNTNVVIQNHLFEDRVMKSSYIKIENGVSIGNMSVVLYDSNIEDNAIVSPMSLVMKGDKLEKQTIWTGIPVVEGH